MTWRTGSGPEHPEPKAPARRDRPRPVGAWDAERGGAGREPASGMSIETAFYVTLSRLKVTGVKFGLT